MVTLFKYANNNFSVQAGSVEGQVVEMGMTTTSLLTAEKFPVIVPNSLFTSQVSNFPFHPSDS